MNLIQILTFCKTQKKEETKPVTLDISERKTNVYALCEHAERDKHQNLSRKGVSISCYAYELLVEKPKTTSRKCFCEVEDLKKLFFFKAVMKIAH